MERTYLIMPSFVPITFTRSESQLSLRGVGENKPYMMDGLAMKSVQKQTVRGLMSESRDFLSKSFARDNMVLPRVAPSNSGVPGVSPIRTFHRLPAERDSRTRFRIATDAAAYSRLCQRMCVLRCYCGGSMIYVAMSLLTVIRSATSAGGGKRLNLFKPARQRQRRAVGGEFRGTCVCVCNAAINSAFADSVALVASRIAPVTRGVSSCGGQAKTRIAKSTQRTIGRTECTVD